MTLPIITDYISDSDQSRIRIAREIRNWCRQLSQPMPSRLAFRTDPFPVECISVQKDNRIRRITGPFA